MFIVVIITSLMKGNYNQSSIVQSEEKQREKLRLENIIVIIGIFIISVATIIPFYILDNYNDKNDMINKITDSDLGVVGDFFGGTTVGLLSLASLMFVAAAMVMQRKELELQRKEVTATREEYQITNRTMKKQSFDSTFFNMINLHQSILNHVKIQVGEDVIEGREAFKQLYEQFGIYVSKKNDDIWIELFQVHWYDKDKKMELIREAFIDSNEDRKNEIVTILEKEIESEKIIKSFYKDSIKDENFLIDLEKKIKLYKYILDDFNKNSYLLDDDYNCNLIFGLLYRSNLLSEDIIAVKENKEELLKNIPSDIKRTLYEDFYVENEPIIGHYYRNLYRIVKYIQEYDFSNDGEVNTNEKKEYRGILRAQLSSYELLMLFYNICYSEKGENFKEILKSTDFFDNHLVKTDFIWSNDEEELKYFKLNS